ncbi:PAAR domain-containing protein [Sphingomonas sp.]|uniref:PAAR domain-containing protein n=1 Tax=Sphingomonas sp. TaxID=28214 RepID=UPI003B3BC39E
MGAAAAARVDDPFGHSSALDGVKIGLAIGALVGLAILTGGTSLIAVGAAVAITGGAGMAGQAIGETIEGPETGVIKIGSRNVFINGRPAAMTVLATGPCSKDSGPPIPVATGAETVLINGQPAGRVGEKMGCSAVIRKGSNDVFIGGPSKEVIKPTPEVPVALQNVMLAMTIGGTAIATLGVGLTYGVGAAVGSLVGGAGGSYLGGQGATAAAKAMGYGETGQAVAGVLGSFAGGAVGGGLGFKGGQAGEAAIGKALASGRPPVSTPPVNTPKLTPSEEAQSWQGKGDYPGVDQYRDITLKKGTVIYAGDPGQSNYYTTPRAVQRSGGDAEALFKGLQVKPHEQFGYRPNVRAYEVTEDTPAAFGITRANPQYGEGGLPQIYIPEYSTLKPLDVTPLRKP